MRRTTKAVINIAVAASVVAGGYLWHVSEMNAMSKALIDEQERAATLDLRVQEIRNQLDASEEEKQSLIDQIEDLITESVVVFDASMVEEQILEIGELATMSYWYTNVGTMDEAKQFSFADVEVPFSRKAVVSTMDGVVKVGIDVADVIIASNEESKTITVTLPDARILSNDPDTDSFQVYVAEENFFSDITLEDSAAVMEQIQNKGEASAIEHGLLDQARDRAGEIICNIIESVPGVRDSYTIIVQ